MRRRSGGIHCQSIEELLQMEKEPSFQENSQLFQFSDIEAFLKENQHQDEAIASQRNSYFLSDLEQMRLEEEELDLSKAQEQRVVATTIALICEDMQEVHNQLLKKGVIFDCFKSLHSSGMEKDQQLSVDVTSNIVNVGVAQKSMNDQKGHWLSNSLKSLEKAIKKLARSKQRQVNEGAQRKQKELELVVYYNNLQLSQKADDSSYLKNSEKTVYQHKFWLIQKKQHYCPLILTYLQQSDYLFSAAKIKRRLELTRLQKPNKQPSNVSFSTQISRNSSTKPLVLSDFLKEIETQRVMNNLI